MTSLVRIAVHVGIVTSLLVGTGCAPVDEDSPSIQAQELSGASSNLIANPSFESSNPSKPTLPLNWTAGNWGTNTVKFTYDTTGHTGSRCGRVDITSYTSGDAKWVADPVTVTPGTTYIYRDYYTSNIPSKLVAAYTLSNGTITNLTLGTVAASSNWSTVAYALTPPVGAVRVTVYHLIAAVGTLRLDDVSLALPQVADLSSGVPNGSFEQTSDLDFSQPLAWSTGGWGSNVAVYTYAQGGQTGQHSGLLTVSNYVNGDAKWYFDPQPVVAGTRYLFSDAYLATAASFVTVRLTMADGTYKYLVKGTVPAASSYAPAYALFQVPTGAVAATVFHGLSQNGTLQIDNAAMVALPPANMVNGVPNGDLEQAAAPAAIPVAWNQNVYGTNAATFSYAANGHSGAHSVRIDMPAYTSGAAAWYYDPQPIVPGQDYVISDFYQANVDTQVLIQINFTDGTQQTLTMPTAFASATWVKYSTDFLAPSNAVSATVLHSLSQAGYLQTDDASLLPATLLPFRRPLVSLTFDDGYVSDYTNVIPVLARHGVPATHFVYTAAVGTDDHLTTTMLTAIRARGDEIGSHTVNHADLTQLAEADVEFELSSSKAFLAANGLGPVVDFACPYGAYNMSNLTDIAALYQSNRTTDVGYNNKGDFDPYRLRVQSIRSTTTATDVAGWAAQAVANGSWLIVVYHDVTEPPLSSVYATTPELLDSQLVQLEAAGLTFTTIQGALAELMPQL